MASQITGNSIVCLTTCSGQHKNSKAPYHQRDYIWSLDVILLVLCWGNPLPGNCWILLTKVQECRKCFHCMMSLRSHYNVVIFLRSIYDRYPSDQNTTKQINTLRPRQNGCHLPNIFKCIFLIENVYISIDISLNFAPKGPITNIPSLVPIMSWRQPGDKSLSKPLMVSLLMHIYVTWAQWVNGLMAVTCVTQ